MRGAGFIALAAGVGAAACTGGGTDGSGFTLKVRPDGTALVVAQDGDGPWQQLVAGSDGIARFEVTTGTYGLLYLCTPDTFASATAFWAAEPPAGIYDVNCGVSVTSATLRGTAAPGAKIWSDSHWASADAAGQFSTWARVGRHDVFAVLPGAPTRFLARRGVDLTADVELALPVATEGVAMTPLSPDVQGATGEVSIYSDLNTTSGDYVVFGEDPSVAHLPPANVLITGDRVTIGARSHGCTRQVRATETAPTLVLPAPLTATVDRQEVTWVADPGIAWDLTSIEMWAPDGFMLRAVATAAWLDAMGDASRLALPDLPSLPGWPASMTAFSAGAEVTAFTGVMSGDYDGDYAGCSHESSLTW